MRNLLRAGAVALALLLCAPGLGQSITGKPINAPAGSLNSTAIYCDDGTATAALCNFGGGTPTTANSTTVNGAVQTANAFQSALAASPTRKGCLIVNTSTAVELVFLGAPASATAAKAIPLAAGQNFSCAAGPVVVADQISITSATAGATFVVVSQ
jgi:hypothetical protein